MSDSAQGRAFEAANRARKKARQMLDEGVLVCLDDVSLASIALATHAREEVNRVLEEFRADYEYLHAPTMGLPAGVNPEEWARDGCSDESAHAALATCISIATAGRVRMAAEYGKGSK